MVTNVASRKLRCKIFTTKHIAYRVRQKNSINIIFIFFNSARLRYGTGTDPSDPVATSVLSANIFISSSFYLYWLAKKIRAVISLVYVCDIHVYLLLWLSLLWMSITPYHFSLLNLNT